MPADTPLTRDGSIPARFIDTVMVPSGDFIAAKVTRCMAEEHSVSCAFADKSNAGSLLLHSLRTSSFMFFDTSRDESLLPSTYRDVRCLFTDTSNDDSWLCRWHTAWTAGRYATHPTMASCFGPHQDTSAVHCETRPMKSAHYPPHPVPSVAGYASHPMMTAYCRCIQRRQPGVMRHVQRRQLVVPDKQLGQVSKILYALEA